jgi:hypothetical protein
MATITPAEPAGTGTAVTFTNASGTGAGADVVATGGRKVVLLVRNTDASSHTVTLTGVVECSQGGLHDTTVTVNATSSKAILISGAQVDTTDNTVDLTWSATTGMSAGAIYV